MRESTDAPASYEDYPVAVDWFRATPLTSELTVLVEPHVHELERANVFLLEGGERDLILDTGMGVVPIRPVVDAIRANPEKEIVCVSSHTHIDHIGGVHEFDTRLVHPAEADEMAAPSGMTSLFSADIPSALRETFLRAGYPALDPLLIDALPHPGYDPRDYVLRGAPATGLLDDGDTVDLGDIRLTVLHLPGHSPGGIGLLDERTGVLFAADAIYDGPLIYEGPGMDVADYTRTLERLRELDVSMVHGGHDPSFGPERMREIIDHYLERWAAGG